MSTRLFFFTKAYPYGKGETFIETEIEYLAKNFDQVIIIPFSGLDKSKREIPINCIVFKPILRNKNKDILYNLLSFKSFKLYFKDFFSYKVYLSFKKIKFFLVDYSFTNMMLKSNTLEKIKAPLEKNDILYFYWGKGWANILPYIRYKNKSVIRLHGGDLYKYRYNGYIPIHKDIMEYADRLIFISQDGKSYLNSIYNNKLSKSYVSYLGTNDFGISKKSTDGILRVLSCSNVIPLKRINKIFETLKLIKNIKIIWTHLGGGAGFNELKKLVELSTVINLDVHLKGHLKHTEVINYYKNNPIDIFINLSTTEGLPVSIMEAISFDIPVIATDVGGTSEIVNNNTGILVENDISIIDLATLIENTNFNLFKPRKFWLLNFNSQKNYINFIKQHLTF